MEKERQSVKREEILGVGFDALTVDQAADRAVALYQNGRGGVVVTPNPEIVYLCRKEKKTGDAVRSADLVLADGIGILYAARILGREIRGRVTGMDFAAALFHRMNKSGDPLFLLGAKPGVAEAAAERLQKTFPGLKIVGCHDGYFQEDGPVVRQIRDSGAKVCLVCLGAPRQELWMHQNRDLLPGVLLVGLGGALDVFSGQVTRAPEGFQKLGLEWLYRLCREPRRIGRMMKLPAFLALVVGERIGGKTRGEGTR